MPDVAKNISEVRVPAGVLWVLASVAVLYLGVVLQAAVHLNHDVSWIVHSARWLLRGAEFGVDVLDPSPPMSWVPSIPAAILANLGLMSESTSLRLTIWLYLIVSCLLVFRLLSREGAAGGRAVRGWVGMLVIAGALTPGFSFGQREHVSVVFAMPYMAALALRLDGVKSFRAWELICIGGLAGLAFSIKHYFLAVPLMMEMWLVWRRGWRQLLRPESVLIGAVIFSYAMAIWIFIPKYLTQTLPLIHDVYWAYDATSFEMVSDRLLHVTTPTIAGLLIAILGRKWSSQHTVLIVGILGYSVSYFVQYKGFVYHAFPVLLCSLVFLGVCVSFSWSRLFSEITPSRRLLPIATMATISLISLYPFVSAHNDIVTWYFQYNRNWGTIGAFREAVISVTNRYAPNESDCFFALSTHPFPGFPTASYTRAEWAGRSATQFVIPAYARIDELAEQDARIRVLEAAVAQRTAVTDDMTRCTPSVVFIERTTYRLGMNGRQFDDLAFYLAEPRFSKLWSRYQEMDSLGPLQVFVLKKAATT